MSACTKASTDLLLQKEVRGQADMVGISRIGMIAIVDDFATRLKLD